MKYITNKRNLLNPESKLKNCEFFGLKISSEEPSISNIYHLYTLRQQMNI